MAYLTLAELEDLALPPGAQGALGAAVLGQLIERGSREADVYLRARYTLPLLSWGDDLRGWVADLVAFHAVRRIGVNPEADDYRVFKEASEHAHRQLRAVSQRLIHPEVQDSAKLSRAPRMASLPLRRW